MRNSPAESASPILLPTDIVLLRANHLALMQAWTGFGIPTATKHLVLQCADLHAQVVRHRLR